MYTTRIHAELNEYLALYFETGCTYWLRRYEERLKAVGHVL